MIVVEGPDGSGKTTLIRQLQEAIPELELQPRVVTKGAQALVDLKQWVIEDLAKGFGPRLYDRYRLISEPIYGPVLRTRMEPGFDDIFWLTHELSVFRRLDPFLIFCLPPEKEVRHNWARTEHEQPGTIFQSTTIYWLYRIEACRWPSSWVHDYTGEHRALGVDTLIKGIRTELDKRCR